VQDELLLGSRAAALREVLRSLECDGATRALLDGFVPDVPGVKPCVPAVVGYSEPLLRALVAAGTGFSIDELCELDRLSAVGVDAREVLYRKIHKRADDIREAALRGVWRFAVASERELHTVAGAAPGAATYVYVAVHGVIDDSPGAASPHEALRLLRMAPEVGLRPYGVAFHVGVPAVASSVYARAIDRCGLVMRRLEQLGTRVEMLGLGGGVTDHASGHAIVAAFARLPYRPSLVVAEP
jgi:ornithine decarboxylase